MMYYVYEDGSLVEQQVESLPPEVEEIYAQARQGFVIDFDVTDWADDDTDAGRGYDYDNSYRVLREPLRHEIVVSGGSLYGFRVHEDQVLVPGEHTEAQTGHVSTRYGYMRTWKLIEEEAPAPADHIFLSRVECSDKDHEFNPVDFPAGLVESVVGKIGLQDSRGYFDGRVRLTLKLTPKAVADPDGTLAAFDGSHPLLAKVR